MRKKNALREHWIAPYGEGVKPVEDDGFLELAKWIEDIEDSTDENVEDYGDYAGDGNPKTEIVSVSEKWTFTGTYDAEDPAQKMIAEMKRKTGDDRKLWHKIVQTDGTTVLGVATASEIIAGSGNALEFETFSCVLNYDNIPEVTP